MNRRDFILGTAAAGLTGLAGGMLVNLASCRCRPEGGLYAYSDMLGAEIRRSMRPLELSFDDALPPVDARGAAYEGATYEFVLPSTMPRGASIKVSNTTGGMMKVTRGDNLLVEPDPPHHLWLGDECVFMAVEGEDGETYWEMT